MAHVVAVSEKEPDCKSGIGRPPRRDDTSTTQHYLWGAYSWDENDFSSLSVWECNYTWSQVEAEVDDGHWSIDPKKPPKLKPSTTQPWYPPFKIPNIVHNATMDEIYIVRSAIPDIRFTEYRASGIQDQVALQIQPYGKFPVEALGDPAKEEEILMSIRQNFAFITAQLANIESRTEVADDLGAGSQSNLSRVNVTINYKSQKRLTQQLKPTCAIIALLSAIFSFQTWGLISTAVRRFGLVRKHWLLETDVKGLAPEGFNSLAATFSLLRDSNVYLYLPPKGRQVSEDELGKTFSRLKFRMGWFETMANKEPRRVFTVGAVDDEKFRFLSGKHYGKI
ncbi:unnamed protein product [Colletotrichum noveboracense]|uniref:Uncharacterized protein n=1 Tax=Colletotrichum noveboracense TaxID=2664923 RepID=A0A9W4W9P8_9PEZI|nr:unnamed protein product [Colletotrichum noveboracense]